jgi:hypothetical protein
MAVPPLGQNGVRTARFALSASFAYLRHDFTPRRINLVCRRDQQGVGLPTTQYPETLSLFHSVQISARLLM